MQTERFFGAAMWANAEKLFSIFTLIRSCSDMERMRAPLKKSPFEPAAAIRRQAWRAERRGILCADAHVFAPDGRRYANLF